MTDRKVPDPFNYPPPRRRSQRDEDEEERHFYESMEEDRLEEERKDQERRQAIDEMVAWFFKHFESPELEHYYDNESGEYLWPFGGPFDAGVQIDQQFDTQYLTKEWRDAAVEEITNDGTEDWSPTTEGDFYEHPEEEPDPVGGIITPNLSKDEAINILMAKVVRLQSQLKELPSQPNFGHNYPPEEIGSPPYKNEDKDALEDALESTRNELDKADPDKEKLQTNANKLQSVAIGIGKYLALKTDLAVDETIKIGIKAGYLTLIVGGAAELGKAIADFVSYFL